MDNFKKYKLAMAAWFGFMYITITFIFPLMGWSQNKISATTAIINLLVWVAAYFILIKIQKKRFNQNNTKGDEKVD
ncbi:hypothetical protein ACLI1A_07420 [Flavobacterium sp. RHBU_3]|uniref:hypothetical protein n=1 Tax=Flavobacterium sp. RHBU_3 TaxID=3391184 RepID=UPI0039847737